MKEVLIITSYFPPETGAASNRIFHLAEGLKERNYHVSVATPLPNYPTGKIFEAYKGAFKQTSIEHEITINRLWIYASNSKNKIVRLFAMLSYSFSLIWFFLWHKVPKTVIVQSPPLLVAFTCMFFLKSKKRQLILNISDLWPIAGLELGAFKRNFSYKILEKIEKFNYKKADLVLGQSEEIIAHVLTIFPNKPTFLYRNFPNFKTPELKETKGNEGMLKIVYAGLLGIAQGVFKLCEELEFDGIEFHIYGAGSEQGKIEEFITNHPELPIIYHGQVSRKELHSELLQYDATLIPLLNRIYGSVPSKIFEYAHLGIPMIYFGGGEGEDIIKKNNLGWVAESGNYDHLNFVISGINKKDLRVDFKKQIQLTALSKFQLETQLNELEKLI